eukprot:s5320_g4.t1
MVLVIAASADVHEFPASAWEWGRVFHYKEDSEATELVDFSGIGTSRSTSNGELSGAARTADEGPCLRCRTCMLLLTVERWRSHCLLSPESLKRGRAQILCFRGKDGSILVAISCGFILAGYGRHQLVPLLADRGGPDTVYTFRRPGRLSST